MAQPQIRTLYELGRGGMGAVDLVEQRGADGTTLCARKRMLPELLRDPRSRVMFLKEARLLARIDHPNVVRTLGIDAGDEEHPPSLLLEYVKGVAVVALLERAPQGLPVALACRIAHDVALGLHAAHEVCDEEGRPLGVVHRDVSPHNIVVTFDGQVKLLDFGVAKIDEGTRTQTGEVRGKVAYMAPEQALAETVDRRSDLYALGAVLYELLTGKRMHGHGTDLEIMRRIATTKPAPPRSLRAEIPEAVELLVLSMTAEPRDDRPATAEQVATALAPIAREAQRVDLAALVRGLFPEAEGEVTTRADAARETSAVAPATGSRRVGWVAAPAVVALAAAAVWLAWPKPRSTTSETREQVAVANSTTAEVAPPPPSAAVRPAPSAAVSTTSTIRPAVTPPKVAPTPSRGPAAPRVDEKPF